MTNLEQFKIISKFMRDVIAVSGLIFFMFTLGAYGSIFWYFAFGMMAMGILSWIGYYIAMMLEVHNIKFFEMILVKRGEVK